MILFSGTASIIFFLRRSFVSLSISYRLFLVYRYRIVDFSFISMVLLIFLFIGIVSITSFLYR